MIEIIITLIIFALIVLILFKIFHTLLKAFFVTVLLAGLALILFGIVILVDINDFRNNFLTSDKLFLLDGEEGFVSGFVMGAMNDINEIKSITKNELEFFTSQYNEGSIKEFASGYYKIFILNKQLFDGIDDNIQLNEQNFSKDFILEAIEAEDSVEFLVQSQLPEEAPDTIKNDYRNTLGDPDVLKAKLFAVMFMTAVRQEPAKFLLQHIKDEKIIIYPESSMFKAVKIVPKVVVDKLTAS